MGIFVNQEKIHHSSVFSPFQRENILVGLGRKHLCPTTYFPSSLSNQTHTKKVFLPIFSPKFSIHLISPPNKHTLRERHWAQGCSQASFDGWEGVMGINYLRLSCRWIRLLLQKKYFFVLVVYKLIHKDVHRLFIKDKKGNGRLIEESEHTLQAIV